MPGHDHVEPRQDPKGYWDARYLERDQIWSGKVNAVLRSVAETLPPGRALDLGCGEGGDAVWLAEQGWEVLGFDISEVAVARARRAAAERGLDDRTLRFTATDLGGLAEVGTFDLVTASFLSSPVELERNRILRRAATLVAPGGHLLITSHAAAPPWSRHSHKPSFHSFDPDTEVAELELDPGEWETLVAEVRHRSAVDPDGNPAELDDSVVLLRRAG